MNISSLRLWFFLFLALSSLPKSGRSKTNIPWMNEYGFFFLIAGSSLVIWLTKTSPRKETALKILWIFLSRCWDTEIFYFHALLFFTDGLGLLYNWKGIISVWRNNQSQSINGFRALYTDLHVDANLIQASSESRKQDVNWLWCQSSFTHHLSGGSCQSSDVGQARMHVSAKALQWCLTLCDPMDCSPPGSSVQGNLQARILE